MRVLIRAEPLNNSTRVVTRNVPAASYHEVIDILREGQLALVVCVKCGVTWNEGDDYPLGGCK